MQKCIRDPEVEYWARWDAEQALCFASGKATVA